MTQATGGTAIRSEHWQERLAQVVETMREMSRHTDPQAMVRDYRNRVRKLVPADRSMSLSRRDLTPPQYRITRSSTWTEEINPWKEPDRLPVLHGGLLGELIYADQPRIIDELRCYDGDPAAEYFAGQRSLMAIPLFDQGVALNMVILTRGEPGAFHAQELPEIVWMSNLFGRATHALALADEVRQAYEEVDRELKAVARIQQSLLPQRLPRIPTLDLAVYYEASRRAGGDYYDFFPLDGGKWGLLIADVAGHGSPAAVLMAILHSIVRAYPGPPCAPDRVLNYVNARLTTEYTRDSGKFITAFYGVYDPAERRLAYANAGHHPPRVKCCGDGRTEVLDDTSGIPLGVFPDTCYDVATAQLRPGDQLLLYTDGITEALNAQGEMFGSGRLDAVLGGCREDADDLIGAVLAALDAFGDGRAAADDRTLLVAKVS